eukprot:6278154-Karenia_brevis.AAC.1
MGPPPQAGCEKHPVGSQPQEGHANKNSQRYKDWPDTLEWPLHRPTIFVPADPQGIVAASTP